MPLVAFPRHVVTTLEGFFGSDLVSYKELAPDGVPFVLSNRGVEKTTDAMSFFPSLMRQNPLIVKLLDQKIMPGLRVSDEISIQEFQRTAVYNEVYRRIDGDYQMACGFPSGRPNSYIGIALNLKSRDFTPEELFLFNLIIPHAQQAYQACRALEAVCRGEEPMSEAIPTSNAGSVIGFDDSYRVIAVGGMAQDLSWQLFQCRPQEGALLPDELLARVLRLKGNPGDDGITPRYPLNFPLPDGSNVVLRLSVDPERAQHNLIFERGGCVPTTAELIPLGLTRREAEVVHWILQGKTSWEVGVILGISSRTIEKHVENIFSKVGVNDRRHLSGRISEMRRLTTQG